MNVPRKVDADRRLFRCSRWLCAWCRQVGNLKGFSRVRKKHLNRSDRFFFRAEDSDEHFLANEIGYVVRVRGVGRCAENENSGPDCAERCGDVHISDVDDMEVRERLPPTEGCQACKISTRNKHITRYEVRRHEAGRNPPPTTRRVFHLLVIAPERAVTDSKESSLVFGRGEEPSAPSLSSASTSASIVATSYEQAPKKLFRFGGNRHPLAF